MEIRATVGGVRRDKHGLDFVPPSLSSHIQRDKTPSILTCPHSPSPLPQSVSPVQALITLPQYQELQWTHFPVPTSYPTPPILKHRPDPLSLMKNPQPTGQSPAPTEQARSLPVWVLESHGSQWTLRLTFGWLRGRTCVQVPTSAAVRRG